MAIVSNAKLKLKKLLFILIISSLLILSLFLVIKKDNNVEVGSKKIKIVTTLFPLYDFTKNVGQDKVEVSLLLPPGVEAHTFEPSPSDIININEADFFIYTGKLMEPWAQDIIKGVSNKNLKVIDASSGIEMIAEQAHEENEHEEDAQEETGHEEATQEEHGGIDPHIWLNFDNDKIIIDTITAFLIERDLDNKDFYQKNADDYKNKLISLDNDYKTSLANCESRELIYGGHYAFAYLGEKYGLSYESAYGISPDSEPSAQDLIKLVEQIKTNKIKYIFFEELVSPKISQTLANETGAGLLLLSPAHNLSKNDFNNNISFLSVMEKNLASLKIGLACK